jgi:hypothetical protein
MKSYSLVFAVSLLWLLTALHAADLPGNMPPGLTDSALAQVRAESAKRCDAYFRKEAGKPFVPAKIKVNWNNRGDYTRDYNHSVVQFATRALYLREQVAEADKALREMCQYHLDRPQTLLEIHSFPSALRPLVQLAQLYGPNGTRAKGLLTDETYQIILKTMWAWASVKSKIADAEVAESHTWTLWDSENHHINHVASCWAVSMFLARDPAYRDRQYEDGHTAQEHYAAWTAYLREYLRERGRKGMMVEVDSPSYSSLALSVGYWVYELTDDPVLKRRADAFLTLWWTLWAEQQIDGVCGGAKARCYPGSATSGVDFIGRAAWYLLGIGPAEFEHESMLPFVTSSWHMPDVVMDLALDISGRGDYEVRERRLGLLGAAAERPHFRLRSDTSALLRYSDVTPDFIMSTLLCEARPAEEWAPVSAQNRWHGVIFRGATNARIYPYCESDHSSYNQQWSVQHKGTLIAQKLKTSTHADALRVWFSKEGLSAPVRDGAWIFAEASGAWAAVRVVSGEADFAPDIVPAAAKKKKQAAADEDSDSAASNDRGRILKCADDFSPVIIEVARKTDFATVDEFRRAVQALPAKVEQGILTYTGLGGDRFTFFVNQSQPPQINGQRIDYAPPKAYDSPFVQSAWDSGVVTIQKGARKLVLNFNE